MLRPLITKLVSCRTSITIVNRTMASSSNLVNVNIDEKTGVATLRMKRAPVNSLSLEMFNAMNESLDKLERDNAVKGLILTSDLPKIFSGGLDIMEMYQPKDDRVKMWWRMFQEFYFKLYGSNLVTVAAINGNSPAGGCVMAMCCDYRIMAQGKYAIGLNETKLGIVAPWWVQDLMLNTIGHRETEKALMLGLLYSPEDALKIGLIDQMVPQDQLMQTAADTVIQWAQIPAGARMATKNQLRSYWMNKLHARREDDIKMTAEFVSKDNVQRNLKAYIEMLSAKSKK